MCRQPHQSIAVCEPTWLCQTWLSAVWGPHRVGCSVCFSSHINTCQLADMNKFCINAIRQRRWWPASDNSHVKIQGPDSEMMGDYRSPGVQVLYKKGQSWLYLLRRLKSFGHHGCMYNLLCSYLLRERWKLHCRQELFKRLAFSWTSLWALYRLRRECWPA